MALAILFPAWPAQARVWHVAEKALPGIDPNDQVATIAAGAAHLGPGDTLLVHGGVYREGVTLDISGTPEQPVTIRAAEGETVTLTGADRLTDLELIPGDEKVYSVPWPHRFVAWNKSFTHPNDDYHRLIGRCEQVFINGYPLRQVLERDRLSRGAFFVDIETQRLYLQPADNQEIAGNKTLVEASTRDQILDVKGSHVVVQGIRFRYAANRAQQGAVRFSGDHITVEDCIFEHTNASGATFTGQDIVVRNCTFEHNGQLGFGASRAHRLRVTGCTVRDNNTKGFDRGWEAGGDKICLTRGAILENSVFADNRGNGIWFDIGNEDCEVRNCLIAHNENAGIFYEISYGLHAHDNVIVGNGFAFTPGAWGAAAGISLSSSPCCTIERNLILGNKEGFNFREQTRSTPRIESRKSEPVWNHDQIIRRNVLAFNRDAQVWGWFDVADERHWPKAMQTASQPPAEKPGGPAGLSLEDLKLTFEGNLYCPGPGQDLFNWGVTWKKHKRYANLDDLRKELSVDRSGAVIEFHVRDYAAFDLRIPPASPAVRMDCYPHGPVPQVQLGASP
ncbi:MAG: right-handed parallel beta-helix repeat-containing protein [Planctomycetes bacterium]|nr:right-handed parallel beta-helix repeat-containing protein [Planctomycetota bacterium]